MAVYLKKGRKNKGKMKCSSCGNEMMRGENILHKVDRNRERYYFCPYCFTYSIVHEKQEEELC